MRIYKTRYSRTHIHYLLQLRCFYNFNARLSGRLVRTLIELTICSYHYHLFIQLITEAQSEYIHTYIHTYIQLKVIICEEETNKK